MPKPQRATPADLSSPWPKTPSTDPEGEVARLLAIRLGNAILYRSVRKVADIAGVDEGTIRNISSGARWPGLRTVVRLEEALGISLWPVRGEQGERQ